MNIWITGCAGFLGTQLALAFGSAGHRVIGLDRRVCPVASESAVIDLSSGEILAHLQTIVGQYGKPDVIIHAATLKPGRYNLAEYVKSNVLATANLLDAISILSPRQFIYTSTLSVYGRPDKNPVDEEHPTRCDFPYAATKLAGEYLFRSSPTQSQVVIFRLPSLYGVGQADSFVDGLASLALQDKPIELYAEGKVVRDALHVSDVVNAIQSCVSRPPASPFLCLNLGCGQAITSRQYAEALVQALESASPIIPVDRHSTQQFDLYADIRAAQEQIGFSPMCLSSAMKKYADELHTQS